MPAPLGRQLLWLLGSQSGAVIEDTFAGALYWLLPPGTTATWHTPGIRALGLGHHVAVPPPGRVHGPGLRWVLPVRGGQWVTDPAALSSALTVARAFPPKSGA